MTRRDLTLVMLLWCAACQTQERGGPVPPPDAAVGPPPAQAPGVAPPPPSAPATTQCGFITQTTTLRRLPSEAREVDEGGKKKKLPNALTTLFRGERVEYKATQGDFALVTLSDGSEGLVPLAALVARIEAPTLATVLVKTQLFARPDVLSMWPTRQLDPAALLIVLRRVEPFSEVNLGGRATAWVLSDALVDDAAEIKVAKVLGRVSLQRADDPNTIAAVQLCKQQFGATRLVQTLLAPPPPQDANVAAAPGTDPHYVPHDPYDPSQPQAPAAVPPPAAQPPEPLP